MIKKIQAKKKTNWNCHQVIMELGNLSIELWVAPDEKSGKLRYAWASKLLASNAAFRLADAVLIFVYPLPVKSECRADRTDGDAGGDGESNVIIASKPSFDVIAYVVMVLERGWKCESRIEIGMLAE